MLETQDVMVPLVELTTAQALRRIGHQQAGMLTTEGGESWHPANLLIPAAAEIDALRDALIWCSGSADFNEGGVAREGWLKIAPLLKEQRPLSESLRV